MPEWSGILDSTNQFASRKLSVTGVPVTKVPRHKVTQVVDFPPTPGTTHPSTSENQNTNASREPDERILRDSVYRSEGVRGWGYGYLAEHRGERGRGDAVATRGNAMATRGAQIARK